MQCIGIAVLILNPGTSWRVLVSLVPRLLCSWERVLGTHQLQGWFDPRACWDIVAKKEVFPSLGFETWIIRPLV